VPAIELRTLLFSNPLLPSTLLIRRTWFERAGLFDESLRRYEDWEFPVRLALAGCRMEWVREVLVRYRRHQANMSTAIELVPVATEAAVGFMTRLFERSDLPDGVRALRGRVFGSVYLDAAARAYGAGVGERGRDWLETAVEYDPSLTRADPPRPPRWVIALSGHALSSLVHDWRAYVRVVAANLPDEQEFAHWSRGRLTASVLAARAFRWRQYGHNLDARASALAAIMRDPFLVRNRGLVKVCVGLR
jgi:hypothetical protein